MSVNGMARVKFFFLSVVYLYRFQTNRFNFLKKIPVPVLIAVERKLL